MFVHLNDWFENDKYSEMYAAITKIGANKGIDNFGGSVVDY